MGPLKRESNLIENVLCICSHASKPLASTRSRRTAVSEGSGQSSCKGKTCETATATITTIVSLRNDNKDQHKNNRNSSDNDEGSRASHLLGKEGSSWIHMGLRCLTLSE